MDDTEIRPRSSAKVKRSLSGAFSALQPKADCTLIPNEFLHSYSEAPRTIQARETSASEGRNYYQGIWLANPEFTKVLGSFIYRKAGTWVRFFHFTSEGRHVEDYSDTRKSNGFGRVRTRLTTRPPKPLCKSNRCFFYPKRQTCSGSP